MISFFYTKNSQCLKTENPRICYKLAKNLEKFQKELNLLKEKKLKPEEYEMQFHNLKEKFLAYEVNIKKHYKSKKSYKIRDIWDRAQKYWHTSFNRSHFDFENFAKNVEYKQIGDKKHKIVAQIKNLNLSFINPANPEIRNIVIRNASLDFYEGEIHAIIGESGSGKSVITSCLYGLVGQNAVIESGEIKLFNNPVHNFDFRAWELSNYRGKIISAVFQNPMSTLNPTKKIGLQIMEGMLLNKIVKTKKEAYEKALLYLKMTKIANPEMVMKLYPHELSGGMIQRIVISSILSLEPKIIVMDEPTTALDTTVQALVLDIIRDLQKRLKITIIFITHDLGVVASLASYISIMYAGQVVEEGTRDEILLNPRHPYTWGLITSMPDVNKGERLQSIRGVVPSSLNSIVGDAFAVRNDYALEQDFFIEPNFYQISPTHRVKSALVDPRSPKVIPPKIIYQKWIEFTKMRKQNER
ncbi:ABC transporter ATP-binding protein [Mycoplasma flocculare]|uniref:Oligopeptide ABC transporter ATP-binding protein n=2 Tax=Mesomycoplasma flocculare TaxID=2128 RepID=A0A0A8E7N5_MESFC|nr:ABC transporter ATP-binding protein [Mesomycoplasma flocculare]MXR39490.1 ABC transporter ATP-binding protein [Mycoplasma sp. MF12]AJC50018.1 oligopeptide ABC transporter ATP-binding protein [Mesomycoplasma flocculare ATCC 27399]MXR05899.1 ABC transporter ATP-binding protein [Mesomycoplasma flocculare]MXR12311.1 ABC transporter ATP-binding protein [Mesomycoplasma flocculare]MXR13526.1 ABC transporter ATP-binding protein [Mesomycoplasma flocculare]